MGNGVTKYIPLIYLDACTSTGYENFIIMLTMYNVDKHTLNLVGANFWPIKY